MRHFEKLHAHQKAMGSKLVEDILYGNYNAADAVCEPRTNIQVFDLLSARD